MESTYSIGVENRYQLFLDSDDDPLEVLKISVQEGFKSKKNKVSVNKSKEVDAPRQVSPKLINNTRNFKIQEAITKEKKSNFNKSQVTNTCITDGTEIKGNREYRRQDRGFEDQQTPFGLNNKKEQDNRYERKNAIRNFKNKSFKENKQEENEGYKSTNHGDMNNKKGGYQNRKQFDRASRSTKTGIKPVDKREGGGARNWGSYQDELNEVSNLNNDQDYSAQKSDERVLEVHSDESAKPVVQEEPKEMTLDEYKALRGNRQKPMYNLRKANEGEDPSQWKKMYTLTKSENDGEEEEEYERIEYPQRAGRQKMLLGIKYFFKDQFSRVGRVQRGGSRMGSARSGSEPDDSYNVNEENDKAENLSQDTPKLYDEKDFPSLG